MRRIQSNQKLGKLENSEFSAAACVSTEANDVNDEEHSVGWGEVARENEIFQFEFSLTNETDGEMKICRGCVMFELRQFSGKFSRAHQFPISAFCFLPQKTAFKLKFSKAFPASVFHVKHVRREDVGGAEQADCNFSS